MLTKIKKLIEKDKKLSYFFIISIGLIVILGLANLLIRDPGFRLLVGAYEKGITVSNKDFVPLAKRAPSDPRAPIINEFTASKFSIYKGESTQLSWNVSKASEVRISNNIGTVSKNYGSISVSPTTSTMYQLAAYNKFGISTRYVLIEVLNDAPPAPTATFSANPTTIDYGASSTLTWNTTNASSVTIDNGIGSVYPSSNLVVTPKTTTTYTLTVVNPVATITKQATVTVNLPQIPTVSFSATPSSVISGGSSKLDWTTTNATTVSIDQGIGSVAPSGSRTVTPLANTTYTLTATNVSGTSVKSVNVAVTQPLVPPINSFSANPLSINAGSSSNLSWNISGANSASINQSVGVVSATTGTTSVSPTTTTTYTLTATNATGTKTADVTVTVGISASLNVRDYGATGNGTTDDTAAILKTINAAIAAGKETYIPDGTYYLASTLTIPNNATIKGQSMTGSWLKGGVVAGSGQNISTLKVGDFGKTFKFAVNSSYSNLTNIHFRGGGGNSGAVLQMGAQSGANYQHHLYFKDCEIERNLGSQVGTYTDYSKPIYNNVSIYGNAVPGSARVTDVKFEGCHFGVSNGAGGHDIGSTRFQVEVWQNVATGGAQGFQHIDFINNVFEASDSGQLDYAGAGNPTTNECLSGNSVISGNLFKGNGYYSSAPWAQDICFEPMCNMTVENNTFWGGRGYAGVAISSKPGIYGYSKNNIFRNNIIDFNAPSGIESPPETRLLPVHGHNNEFSGNTITLKNGNNLFWFGDGNDNKVINNKITVNNPSTSFINLFVIGKTAGDAILPSNNTMISGNTFVIPNITADVRVFSGTNNKMINNKFCGKSLPRVTNNTGANFEFSGNTLNTSECTLLAPNLPSFNGLASDIGNFFKELFSGVANFFEKIFS